MDLRSELKFDISGEEAEASGGVGPGWYKVVVEDVTQHEKIEDALELVFAVTGGAYKGAKIRETLFDPARCETEEKEAKAKQRLAMITGRLGLWDGKVESKCKPWSACIGREMVVEVAKREWKDGVTGAQKSFTGVTYGGIFPPDHEKIPADIRKTLGLPPAAAGGGMKDGTPAAAAASRPTNGATARPSKADRLASL